MRDSVELGAHGVVVDALDREAVRRAVLDAAPEAVIDELTALPRDYNLRDPHLYDANDEVRSKGTPALHDAAREAGVRRFVMQSIAFLYAPEGDWVKSEDARPWLDAPMPFRRGVGILDANEQRVVAGGRIASLATQLRGASNAKAKAELGWQPALPTWREGFMTALDSGPATARV